MSEFPKSVYSDEKGLAVAGRPGLFYKLVKDETELEAALDDGFRLEVDAVETETEAKVDAKPAKVAKKVTKKVAKK